MKDKFAEIREEEEFRQKLFEKQSEERRQKEYESILETAKTVCPIPYPKLVHTLYYQLGLSYLQNTKRGVYNRELDSLIAIGKLYATLDSSGLLIVLTEKPKLKRKHLHRKKVDLFVPDTIFQSGSEPEMKVKNPFKNSPFKKPKRRGH